LVHFYSDRGTGAPTSATVTVRFDGATLAEISRTMIDDQLWDVGSFIWAGGTGSFRASPLPLSASLLSDCQ
jgi:hypothetical protein